MKHHLGTILKICIAFALVYWIIQSGKIDLKSLTKLFDPVVFTVLLLISGVNLFITSERWRILLLSQKFQINSLKSIKLTLIGNFFNYFIPGGVGGDVVKAYYVSKEVLNEKTRAVLTVLMDRILGLYSMMVLAIFSLLCNWSFVESQKDIQWIFYFLLSIFFAFTFVLMLIFSSLFAKIKWLPKILEKLPYAERFLKLYTCVTYYGSERWVFIKTLVLSFFGQVLGVSFFILTAYFLHLMPLSAPPSNIENPLSLWSFPLLHEIPLSVFFFAVPLGFMITAVPISPAGIGVGQAAFHYLFTLAMNKESAIGATSITAFQFFLFIYGIIGAVIYIFNKPKDGIKIN